MNISRAYKIETERLLIRCYKPADAALLLDAITSSLDHLKPWLPWAKKEPTDLETKINLLRKFRGQFDLGEDYTFGIFDKNQSELIGSAGLHNRLGPGEREIGYWIGVKHLNKGYAQEAVCALTKVGFEVENLSRIEIHCAPLNIRSLNVPQKLGYRLEKTLSNPVNSPIGSMVWGMNKAGYDRSVIKRTQLKAFDIIDQPIDI
jgi:RimJ/RimL family protein N-acetyltransferase